MIRLPSLSISKVTWIRPRSASQTAARRSGRVTKARKPRKHQDKRRNELPPPVVSEHDRLDREAALAREVDPVEAAIGSPHLVLAADALANNLLLDTDRLVAELGLAHHAAAERVKGVEQADRKGGARSEARAGGQVGVVMDFEALIDREFRKHRPHCGVHNLGCLADLLDFGIHDAVS